MSDQNQLGLNAAWTASPTASNADHALDVLAGRDLPFPISKEARKVLHELVWHKGAAQAIQIKELVTRTKLSDRAIKDAVRSLVVDFKVRIAGSRQEPYGYYLVMTAAEAIAAAAPLIHEIQELALRAGVLTDEVFISEQQGQMRISIPKDAA